MPKELDVLGISAISGWIRLRKKRANVETGKPCQNCQTKLEGAYCYECGQFAEDFHRSIFGLCAEFVESFFHLDGRVWQTLPKLLFLPGRLTRDYLDGKRIVQIPPFRMFIVFLFTLFLVGEYVVVDSSDDPLGLLKKIQVDADKDALKHAHVELDKEIVKDPGLANVSEWLKERAANIRKSPERFLMILEVWGYRVAILTLPMMALLLTLLFAFQRRFYVYDHIVFSIHSITFHLILLTVILVLTLLIGSQAWWLSLCGPVHLWFHMRKVYSTSVFGTVLRQLILGIGTFVGFMILALLWIFIGVNAMS